MEQLKEVLDRAIAAEDWFGAIDILDRLMAAEPDNLDYRFRLGTQCRRVGKVERARALFASCARSGYAHPLLYLNLGHALKALRRSDEAADSYRRMLDTGDDQQVAIAWWSLADLKDYRFGEEEAERLRERLQNAETKPGYRGLMLFALACAREQQGRVEEAFMAMSEANLILAAHRPFRADLYGKLVMSLTREVGNPAPALEADGPTPVFIVGMPRSGTTLVEQILASHSQVEPTDELPYLERYGLEMEQKGGYASVLAGLGEEGRAEYAARFLAAVDPHRRRKLPYFIDKNPSNFLHVGLIKALFPQARIINVVRDPLDNAMSVFKQYFNKGNEFSYSLDGIVYYWQGYVTLMRHWHQLYPDAVMHLAYEDLAAQPEREITRILEYCGLPVEPGCFRFYESDQPVLTPSASQVREPITTKSVGSGRKFEPFIKPTIPALAEIKRKTREVLGVG
jgi:tetratricopeptide (TPR) repeat protein